MTDFNVKRTEPVTLHGPPALAERDLMSPYVWRERDGRYGIAVRAVPKAGCDAADTGIIWAGWSPDGVVFEMAAAPALTPGPDEIDRGGVEDPTVIPMEGGYAVYYTGVEADRAHGELLYADGPSMDALTKRGVALASTKSMGNTKEATVELMDDGRWRLFYEFARDEASLIGVAIGAGVAGPWEEQPAPFGPRTGMWDNWHLSTGPLLMDRPDAPVMFYNGATRDARWRIGWVMFDADCTRVVERCVEPMLTPPPNDLRTDTDIAFAGSVVSVDDAIWLYYSLEDRRLARALIRRS